MTTLDTGVTITTGKIPLLMEEARNWVTWKTHIEAKLTSIEAKDVVLGKETCPPAFTTNPALTPAENQAAELILLEEQSDWDKCDAKAYNLIVENINDNHLSLFEDSAVDSSSHLAYNRLLTKYTDTLSGVSAFYTKMELVEYQYTKGDSIAELVAFFQTTNTWLAGMKKDFDGETLAFLILHSLPKTQEWKNVISNIVQSQPSGSPLTVPIVEAQLLQIERLQHGQENNSTLAVTRTRQIQTPASIPTTATAISPNEGCCLNCHKGFHATENCQAHGGAK